ncbi:MAG: peptidase S41 [Vicingaceae bacterium]|nr:MAG: peptidase S41 [Vicingaceae bacterium]
MKRIVISILGWMACGLVLAQMSHHESIRKIETVLYYIENGYVDTVDPGKLAEKAIVGMLESLDPHSVYIPKEEVQAMNEPLEGNFEGIGIEFQILQDTVMVVHPIIGGPSEILGIRAGDKIIKVNDTVFAGIKLTNRDVVKKLRGPKGTKVKVSIMRAGNPELIDFVITRDKIPIYSVDAAYMIDKKTGYVKISRFAKETDKEFREAMEKLKKQGLENLILDLQGNGGGYLNTAVQLADEFLDNNKLIVYTLGAHHPKEEYKAINKGVFEKGKLVVLIDEGSASASEIVSGAIQDWDRGLIVGRRSFGKGLVQRPYALADGSFIRLTTGRYYTPTGRSIQKPYDENINKYRSEIYERMKSGELNDSDKIKLPDSLKFKTPAGRVVYGGGGIVPDVFVPIDTSGYSKYYSDLVRKGILNDFVLNYIDKKREELLKSYPDMQTFKSNADMAPIQKELYKFAEEKKLEPNQDQMKISDRWIAMQLKANIARHLYGNYAYFYIINDLNPIYLKGVEVVNSKLFDEMKLSYK